MPWGSVLHAIQQSTWQQVPANLEVFGEAPVPRHRQGWRRWLSSVGARWMALTGAASFVCCVAFFWSLYQGPTAFMTIIPATLGWMFIGRKFLDYLRVFRGDGITAAERKWCLHRLRLDGQDPDPLFLRQYDLQRAVRINEGLVRAAGEKIALEAATPLTTGQPRVSRL